MPSRFKVLKSLEDNTTSTLQLVRDSRLKCDFLLRRFKTTDAGEIDGLVRLFAQLAVLDSPRLDRIVEADVDAKGFYVLLTAPLEGVTLTEMIQRGPLSAEEFEVLAMQLLDAIELVHDQSIVHGTLTPDCVRIMGVKPSEWQIKLGGFGIGFSAAGTEVAQQVAAYRCAAPEQWQKTAARRRTDIYSLGCVFYEALAGRPAFQSRGLKELRAKHLSRDLQDLAALAPHVPRWMTGWVMSLIVTDSEARPRKASVARENFVNRVDSVAPEAVSSASAAVVEATGAAVQAVVSEPVALPVTQPARTATASTIPITVGLQVGPAPAPRRSAAPGVLPRPASKRFSQQPLPRPIWKKPLSIGMAAVVGVSALWLVFRTSDAPSLGSPKSYEVPATAPEMQNLRDVGVVRQRYYASKVGVPAPDYPGGFPPPLMPSRLITHFHADFGVSTYDGTDGDQPAREGDAVALWRDLGTIRGDNSMAMVPWNPRDHRITLSLRKPDSADFVMRAPRRFVVFGKGSKPVSALGTIGALSGDGVPFADSKVNGVTLAILFYVDPQDTTASQTPVRLNFSDQAMTLQCSRPNSPRISLGTYKEPNVIGNLELAKGDEFDCTQPTLIIATWGRDGKAMAILHNSGGDRRVVSATAPVPTLSLQNMALGGDAYWAYREAGSNPSGFHGGIAECRLYSGVLSAGDLNKLEDELASRYFP